MAQVGEEPPFLTVGTEVSAKYRGAFCEASIKSVKKVVKCKVTFSKTNSSSTVNDDCIKGTLKVGSTVEVKSQDGHCQEASILKLTDASVYTVVFDDGDERTLRRTSLCLKGERHFNVSETLDHLPLTDPENFGTPVMQDGKKRKKRSLSLAASMDDSETEKDDTEPPPSKKKIVFNDSIVGKVVVIENSDKKKHTWFPGLGVSPNSSDSHLIKTKDQCLVRSFKDGKYHVINLKNIKKFGKNVEPVISALKGDNRTLKLAIERALSYEGTGKVPVSWEDNNSSNGEEGEDEDTAHNLKAQKAFNQKLFTFMEERGTPIVRPPVLGNQDLNLHKLYNLVKDIGGMEKVSSAVQWRTLYSKMNIPVIPPSASHHIKMAYKKYLYSYEMHEKGVDITGKDTDSERSNDDKVLEESSTGRTSRNSLRIEERERQNEAKQLEGKTGKELEKTKRNDSEESEVEIESDAKSPESEEAVDVVNSPGTASVESDQTSESRSEDGSFTSSDFTIGDKVQVKYGRGRNQRLYEAKIISTDTEAEEGLMYCVHYAGWNNRYNEWIRPDKISGIGPRQTRKRSTSVSKETVPSKGRKSPPKPVVKASPKLSGKKNSKSSLPASSPKTNGRGTVTNGGKGTRRGISPSRKPDIKKSLPALAPVTRKSPSPALGKSGSTNRKSPSPTMGKSVSGATGKPSLTSPKSGPGRGRLRTERQNSMPDLRRSDDEGMKSQALGGGRRRKKSLTPEPTSSSPRSFTEELSPLTKPLADDDAEHESSEKTEERVEVIKSEPETYNADDETKANNDISETLKDIEDKTEVSSELSETHEDSIATSRKRETLNRVNGLINPSDLDALAPAGKLIRLDQDSELADKEIENLLKDNTQVKSPVESPQTEGSITSGDFSSCCSSEVKLKPDEVGRIVAESALDELKSVKEERSESPVSSLDNSDGKDKKESGKVFKLGDRKNCERHHKRHKSRREKRKNRLNSGNESTGSDVPPSPGPSCSPFCKPSPNRPRITFDQDLEQIKAKTDSAERIRLLQEKIGEMRKVYSSLKAEVASIDRKKKRLRKKREEQAAAAATIETMKDSKPSSSSVTPPNVQAVECR